MGCESEVSIYTYIWLCQMKYAVNPDLFFSSLSVCLYFFSFGSSVVVGSFLSPLTLRSSLHNH